MVLLCLWSCLQIKHLTSNPNSRPSQYRSPPTFPFHTLLCLPLYLLALSLLLPFSSHFPSSLPFPFCIFMTFCISSLSPSFHLCSLSHFSLPLSLLSYVCTHSSTLPLLLPPFSLLIFLSSFLPLLSLSSLSPFSLFHWSTLSSFLSLLSFSPLHTCSYCLLYTTSYSHSLLITLSSYPLPSSYSTYYFSAITILSLSCTKSCPSLPFGKSLFSFISFSSFFLLTHSSSLISLYTLLISLFSLFLSSLFTSLLSFSNSHITLLKLSTKSFLLLSLLFLTYILNL